MGRVVKKSLSFPEDVFAELEAEAAAQGISVSALVTRAAQDAMIRERGLRAVAEWEAENGAFTEEELAEADRILDEAGL
jgi:hypothetical protein